MKRIMVTRIGEARDSLEVHDVPNPQPKKGEILVEMLAIPIHPADLLVMRGRHVFTATYPIGTGIEGAGRVIAHGEGVTEPAIGQRVALPFGGTWAEQVTIPASAAIPLPDDIDLYQGAMLALNPITALGLLMGMKPGEWLVHNAANSSLGRLITRLAHKGIHSISVVRTRIADLNAIFPFLESIKPHHFGLHLPKRIADLNAIFPFRKSIHRCLTLTP